MSIMVSIFCTAYNHERYIRKCLEGFINQITDFNYEVIVHDDASTDSTAKIIREYETKYPDIIKPIYQSQNQYSQGVSMDRAFMAPKAQGKYIAICEGDDYWTDPYKLQKQFDAMEKNPQCRLCVCKVERISEDESEIVGYCPNFNLRQGVISSEDFLKIIFREYAFHTSSYFFRREDFWKEPVPTFKKVCPVGDEAYLLYLGQLGDVYYLDHVMSRNRRNSIGGWNQVTWASKEKTRAYYKGMLETYKEYDLYTNGKYHELCEQRIFMELNFLAETRSDFRGLLHSNVFKKQPLRRKMRIISGAYFPVILRLFYSAERVVKNAK